MTDRTTRVRLDFTPSQIIDGMRAAGWVIPDPADVSNLKIDATGARVEVSWRTVVAETPPP